MFNRIQTAAATNNLEGLKKLHELSKKDFDVVKNCYKLGGDPFGNTPLTQSLANAQVEAPIFLIETAEVDINLPAQRFKHYTPLMIILGKGIDHRDEKDPKNRKLEDVYNVLMKKSNINVTAKSDNGNTALHFAAAHCNYQAIKDITERGGNIDEKNDDGVSPRDLLESKSDALRLYFLNEQRFTLDLRTNSPRNHPVSN